MSIFGVLPSALRRFDNMPGGITSQIQARQLSSEAKRLSAQQRSRAQLSAGIPDAVRAADVQRNSHQAQLRIEANRKRAQERKSASLQNSVCFRRNPSAIKEAHETEAKRLAALKREIEADIRVQAWKTPKN